MRALLLLLLVAFTGCGKFECRCSPGRGWTVEANKIVGESVRSCVEFCDALTKGDR